MAIQSSVNALMQQLYNVGAIGAGLMQQRKQTAETKLQTVEARKQTEKIEEGLKTAAERYREYKGIPTDAVLHPAQQKATDEAEDIYQHTGYVLEPETIDRIASMNFKQSVEAAAPKFFARRRVAERTNNLNQTKSDFDAHTASLIKEYGKGSGRP